MTEAQLLEKIQELTPKETWRVGLIMQSIATMVHAMMECHGPDDARIALSAAIMAVFGINAMPLAGSVSMGYLGLITTEFALDEVVKQRRTQIAQQSKLQ